MKQTEGALPPQPMSETAASATNRLFGASGVIPYRVQMQGHGGAFSIDVDAETGDDAAANALAKHPGVKVLHIEPAPRVEQAA